MRKFALSAGVLLFVSILTFGTLHFLGVFADPQNGNQPIHYTTVDDLTWTSTATEVTITGLTPSALALPNPLHVVIPSVINDLPVRVIHGGIGGQGAFEGVGIVGITIPDNVTHINAYAFAGNQLTSLVLPGSVTHLGLGAFTGNQLTSLTLNEGLLDIGQESFMNNNLTSVRIPDGVTHIRANAFVSNQLRTLMIPTSVVSIGAQIVFWNPDGLNIFLQTYSHTRTYGTNWSMRDWPIFVPVIRNATPHPEITFSNPFGTVNMTATDINDVTTTLANGDEIDWATTSVNMAITHPGTVIDIKINGQSLAADNGRLTNNSAMWTRGAFGTTSVQLDLSLIGHNLHVEVVGGELDFFNIITGVNHTEAGTVTPDNTLTGILEGTQRTLTATTNSGWEFSHWTTTSGTLATPNESVTLFTLGASNAIVTAHFEEISLTQLDTPEDLNIDNNILTWSAVENAVGYIIIINDQEFMSKTTSFNLSNIQELIRDDETLSIRIVAIGDGISFTNSSPSENLNVTINLTNNTRWWLYALLGATIVIFFILLLRIRKVGKSQR
ncbi:MAG: leucine-rich repeat protein [Firmicutes bacterium]|nr:leucine-rich repeat protein [Bacillota bacterium]